LSAAVDLRAAKERAVNQTGGFVSAS
jgi:hypothetical protein